ncbi:MAG TPA: LbtU family siderophore porin [Desulfobacteraceae bacterium]|nr:LbtU family siderophore porin [Desulfobacteraceae bacterium]
MKRFSALVAIFATAFLAHSVALAQEISNEEIRNELKILRARINKLELEVSRKDREIEGLKAKVEKPSEAASAEEGQKKWTDRIELSGAIEVEYGSEKHKVKDPTAGKSTSSRDEDLTLSTVELHTDAQINKYTKGHVVFLYEEDEDEDRVRIDEGTIRLGGIEETHNLYFQAGKYYPHFGELNSWFVSDPLTCQIFEIQESAAEAGYDGSWFSTGAGAFHGDVQKTGDDESRIKGFFADANIHNPEDTLGGVSLLAGISYLSNVADTDTLQDEVNQITDYVGGVALYLVAEYHNFSFGAEYITALDDFHAGEMGYAIDRNGDAQETKPAAWNMELAYRPMDPLQLAVKYEGTGDKFGLFPEKQYGLCVSYDLFESTTLSAEYLHGDYDDNNQNGDGNVEDSRDAVTLQLAVEF